MSKINLLRDLKQISKKENAENAESHIFPWSFSGDSNKGSCKSLRAKKVAGIKLPENTGLKADKGAMEVGTMHHETLQKKLKKKYANHPTIKCMDEVYTKQQIVPPSDHKITVNTERSYFPKGTILKDGGMTGISPVDFEFYTLKDKTKTGIYYKTIQFKNKTVEVPFLNHENTEIIQIVDIKSASDFAFAKYKKEGISYKYQAQGHIYMKANNLKSIDFLFVHKQKNQKYIIRLNWSDDTWEKIVADQERVLQLAYELLEYDKCKEFNDDFECLDKEIGWWSCPLSHTREIENYNKKTLEILEYCPQAQKYLINQRDILFPLDSEWKNGRYSVYIEKHGENVNGVATVTYLTKTEWNKKNKGNSYTAKELPLTQAYLKFKSLDYKKPRFPKDQTLIEFEEEPEIDACTDCYGYDHNGGGYCTVYSCIPNTFPERPDWCFFPIPKEVKK